MWILTVDLSIGSDVQINMVVYIDSDISIDKDLVFY